VIQPTVGRVVWYYPTKEQDDQPQAALVTYVHDDRLINVGGFDHAGHPFQRTEVQLLQDDDKPEGFHAMWMPYQKGQAAKTEELEAAAKGKK